MQQNLLSVLEISNAQYPKLLESNPNLVTNSNFTFLPAWFDKYLKDELIIIFERVKKRILNDALAVSYKDIYLNSISTGFNAQNWDFDQLLFKASKRQEIVDLYNKIDTYIYQEIKLHSKLGFVIKQSLSRSLCIIDLGKIKFNRTQYKIKINNHTHTIILLDYFLNLRKRGILQKGAELKILSEQNKNLSTRELATKYGCCKQTIANSNKHTSLMVEERVVSYDACNIFAAADGSYTKINGKKGRIYEIKTIVLWSDSTSVTKSSLPDRVLLKVDKKDIANLDLWLKEKASVVFPNWKSIKVIGDGAKWIKKLGSLLYGFYLDKFHYTNAFLKILYSLISGSKKNQKLICEIAINEIYKNAKSDNPQKTLQLAMTILEKYANTVCEKNQHKIINNATGEILNLTNILDYEMVSNLVTHNELFGYINGNWKYFKKTCIENIINPIEALQAHFVTSCVRKNRSANSEWVNHLKLSFNFAVLNQFKVKVLINNPLSNIIEQEIENNQIPNNTVWYNLNQVTITEVSRNRYSNVHRSPRVGSVY